MSDGAMAYPHIDRIRRLRKSRGEVWQGTIIRVPQWVVEEGQAPVRPILAVWFSMNSGRINTGALRKPSERNPAMLLDAMAGEGGGGQGIPGIRPEKLVVADESTAEYLRQELGAEFEISVKSELPGINSVMQHMQQKLPVTSGYGFRRDSDVTPQRLRAFAEAAADFYRAAPWQHLIDEDLIRIESPAGREELSHISIMGAGGTAFGLAFFRSPAQHAELEQATDMRKFHRKHGGLWAITFGPIMSLPLSDADHWEDDGFPVAGANAYPTGAKQDSAQRTIDRPDAATLAFMEGVMRALAATSEDELDRGRWTKKVSTADGEVEFTLALPGIVDETAPAPTVAQRGPTSAQRREMERALARLNSVEVDREFATPQEAEQFLREELEKSNQPEAPITPLIQAEDLVDQAAAARGRKRLMLLRKALEICPDCADAHLAMAYRERDPHKMRPLFERAVEAGRKMIPAQTWEQGVGEFWRRIETRPFMRATMGLGECLRAMNLHEEAAVQFKEMIRLNPADHQAARYRLISSLLELNRKEEVEELVGQFPDDHSALWGYAKALVRFRKEGDTNAARDELADALDANGMVPQYLLKKKELPPAPPPSFRPGSEDEAVVTALELLKSWEATPGAVYWLAEQRRRRREREEKKKK
jgi:tetratricopeptide (TPR) repeat protein